MNVRPEAGAGTQNNLHLRLVRVDGNALKFRVEVVGAAERRCSPLTAKTHVFDAATKAWLLPLAATHSRAVKKLLPRMKERNPEKRLLFTECIDLLRRSINSTDQLP